jgi:hypothetical protein
MRALLMLVFGLLGPLTGALSAQRLQPSRFPTLDSAVADRAAPNRPRPIRPDGALLAAGGVLGAVAGLFGGAWIGAGMTESDCDDCGIVGAVYGGIAGGSAFLPLGVHLANDRRGRYGPSLLASLAIGAAGLGLASATEEWRIMLGVPIVQIASSIAIERGTARRRMAGDRDP